MKTKFSTYILLIFIIFSCKKNATSSTLQFLKNNEISKCKDTTITTSGIYLFTPNKQQLDSLKISLGEENFYTIADDSNFYIAEIFKLSKKDIKQIKFDCVDFSNEHYLFQKMKQQNSWLVIDYNKGNKPKIYNLLDYYSQMNKKVVINTKNISNLSQNDDFTVTNIDINGDGKDDKIFSNKPLKGDSLYVYFQEKNSFKLKLSSTNLSQDGGHQVTNIEKYGKGFSIITSFPKGTDRYVYNISYNNEEFIIEKVIHIAESWQNKTKQKCQFSPKVNMKFSTKEIFDKLISSEEQAKCY